MREIKFRGLHKENRKMDYTLWSEVENKDVLLSELIKEIGKYFEIMQYTGLKDKNGVEIYEGDVVRICPNEDGEFDYVYSHGYIDYKEAIGVVVYKDGGFFVKKDGCPNDMFFELWEYEIEVIGNIHQNKNLLEATNGSN